MINPRQLRDHIVIPVLTRLTPDEPIGGAVELMMGTAMQESRCGEFIAQVGGPALGVWQMEPATHNDIWQTLSQPGYATARSKISDYLGLYLGDASSMVGNLYYACAMARMLYRRIPERLPAAGDIVGQAEYYKRYYNTPLGAATIGQYLGNWRELQKALA